MAKEDREAYREGKWALRMLRLSRWPVFSRDRINHHGKRRAGRWAKMKECKYEKKFPLQANKNAIWCGYTGYCEIKGETCFSDCPLYRPRMIFRLKRMWKRLWK